MSVDQVHFLSDNPCEKSTRIGLFSTSIFHKTALFLFVLFFFRPATCGRVGQDPLGAQQRVGDLPQAPTSHHRRPSTRNRGEEKHETFIESFQRFQSLFSPRTPLFVSPFTPACIDRGFLNGLIDSIHPSS